MHRRSAASAWIGALLLVGRALVTPAPASAELPDAPTLVRAFGLSDAEIEQAKRGELVSGTAKPSNPRELTATLVFLVEDKTPTELVKRGQQGLLDEVDPTTIAFHIVEGVPKLADFAKLDPSAKLAKAFATAKPGGDLNLSKEEIAAFHALGADAAPSAVVSTLRKALLARFDAYRTKGLDGIAPYVRGGGELRSPAEDLRSATKSLKVLEKYAPTAYRMLLDYPNGKPPGTEDLLRWSYFEAHGEPTIVLTHDLYVPDGDAWVVAQRQFYASTGYNCEQAVAAFLPYEGGTAVLYGNRTSTDQVTGFGGDAKRSLGSRILASSLEKLFESARAKATSK